MFKGTQKSIFSTFLIHKSITTCVRSVHTTPQLRCRADISISAASLRSITSFQVQMNLFHATPRNAGTSNGCAVQQRNAIAVQYERTFSEIPVQQFGPLKFGQKWNWAEIISELHKSNFSKILLSVGSLWSNINAHKKLESTEIIEITFFCQYLPIFVRCSQNH